MSDLRTGDRIGKRYVLDQCIGRGAYSEVWEAKDYATGSTVAVKIPMMVPPKDTLRLLQIILSQYNLRHKNIVPVISGGIMSQRIYFVIPFYKRGSVGYFLKKNAFIAEKDCWKLLYDVGSALSVLHCKDIFHKDIRPENILIDDNGGFVLTDCIPFLRGNFNFTYDAYGASERYIMNGSYSKTSDIWALGAVLFELMVGVVPFGDKGGLFQVNGAEIPEIRGDYSQELKSLIYGMLAKEPDKRPTAVKLTEDACSKL